MRSTTNYILLPDFAKAVFVDPRLQFCWIKACKLRLLSFPIHHDHVFSIDAKAVAKIEEQRATREAVALYDQTSFSKLLLLAPGERDRVLATPGPAVGAAERDPQVLRGAVDGRSVRLPTVMVRDTAANSAINTPASVAAGFTAPCNAGESSWFAADAATRG